MVDIGSWATVGVDGDDVATATLTAPDKPGTYSLRHRSKDSLDTNGWKQTETLLTVTTKPTVVTTVSPASVVAGATTPVTLSGEVGDGDRLVWSADCAQATGESRCAMDALNVRCGLCCGR